MHRELLGLDPGDPRQGDHRNRDRLDNRMENLRILDPSQQAQNMERAYGTSSYRGVSWHKQTGKWRAYVSVGRKQHYLGLFEHEEDAAEAARRGRATYLPFAID